jgi:hypothetical protein
MSTIVPFQAQDPRQAPVLPAGDPRGPLDKNTLLMAAAQMHKEGRLIKGSKPVSGPGKK